MVEVSERRNLLFEKDEITVVLSFKEELTSERKQCMFVYIFERKTAQDVQQGYMNPRQCEGEKSSPSICLTTHRLSTPPCDIGSYIYLHIYIYIEIYVHTCAHTEKTDINIYIYICIRCR